MTRTHIHTHDLCDGAGTYAHAARAPKVQAGRRSKNVTASGASSANLVAVLLINRGSVARNATLTFNSSLPMRGGQGGSCAVQEEWHVTTGPDVVAGGAKLPGILINGQQPVVKASYAPTAFDPRRAPCGATVEVAARSWTFVLRSP